MQEEQNCSNCPLRSKYDNKPKSLLGHFWRWHIKFCPGWKKYFSSLPENEKMDIAMKYNLKIKG